MRPVKRLRWQIAQREGNTLRGDFVEFSQLFPREQFREPRGAGDGRGAPATQKARFTDGSLFNRHRYTQNIAANRIAYFNRGGGVFQFAGVPRMFEMVEHLAGKHGDSMSAHTADRQVFYGARFFGGKYRFSMDAITT